MPVKYNSLRKTALTVRFNMLSQLKEKINALFAERTIFSSQQSDKTKQNRLFFKRFRPFEW